MPRPPHFETHVVAMPDAVYSPFRDPMAARPGPIYALHVGDTWMEPFEGARMEAFDVERYPGMHRYSDTRGLPALLDAVVEKARFHNGLACERDSVLVTAGATSGISTAVGSIVAPGEEVLILAPFWPLVRGIVQSFRAEPVEVPFYDRVDSPEEAVAALGQRLSERTVALYVSTPSNPTGRCLSEAELEALAEFARREDLWLLSDEVYEDYVYAGEHFSIGRLAPERTVTFFSFSKAYGMAGNRVGYLVGPAPLVAQAHKVSTHSAYHAPTASQLAGLAALRDGGAWVETARSLYRDAGAAAARALGLPPPQGSTFLFVEVESALDERGLGGFLEDCFADGVLVAPGASAGSDYGDWIRLCYTSAPPEQVERAIAHLARRLTPRSQ